MSTPTTPRTKIAMSDGSTVTVSRALGHLDVEDGRGGFTVIEFTDAERIALIEALGGHA